MLINRTMKTIVDYQRLLQKDNEQVGKATYVAHILANTLEAEMQK